MFDNVQRHRHNWGTSPRLHSMVDMSSTGTQYACSCMSLHGRVHTTAEQNCRLQRCHVGSCRRDCSAINTHTSQCTARRNLQVAQANNAVANSRGSDEVKHDIPTPCRAYSQKSLLIMYAEQTGVDFVQRNHCIQQKQARREAKRQALCRRSVQYQCQSTAE